MKPFNLEKALAGEPVITRNGLKIQELVFLNYQELIEPIIAKIEGRNLVLHFYRDGSYFKNEEDGNDLFMATTEKYFNVYHNGKEAWCGTFCDTPELAKEKADQTTTGSFVTTIKIEL